MSEDQNDKAGEGSIAKCRCDDYLKLMYQEICTSYRAIDDFRTKLLSLLPLATGGIFFYVTQSGSFNVDPKGGPFAFLQAIGWFGIAITFGLFCFELYGIRKCTALILLGESLEKHVGVKGQFSHRPPGVLFGLINEPFAAGIIYPAVMSAWAFLARHPNTEFCLPLGVFFGGFLLTLLFIQWLVSTEVPRLRREYKYWHCDD